MAWFGAPTEAAKPIRANATVIAADPFVDGNKYRKPVGYIDIWGKLDDGRSITIKSVAGCVPYYRAGDRLKLLGVPMNGGRIELKIVDSRCPS